MKLNQEQFEAWLFSQPKDRVIESAHGGRCVLCSFVKETTPHQRPWFTWTDWIPDTSVPNFVGRFEPIPVWARTLIDPEWLRHCSIDPLILGVTVGQMQARYRELFPDRIPEPQLAPLDCDPAIA